MSQSEVNCEDPVVIGPFDELIDENLDDAVEMLARMIAVDTTFPPGRGYAAFADLAEEMLVPLGFVCRRVTVPEDLWRIEGGPASGERVNLIAEMPGSGPVCSLYFHVDTVCAAAGWTQDPFTLTERDGVLTGLGAADMKGALAAAIHALRCLREAGTPMAYRPQLLLCTDEEGGLYPGIRYLAEQGLIGGHLLNFNGSATPRIWAGCFGSFNLQVTVEGVAAHAADGNRGGQQGLNAIEAALPMMQAVQSLRPRVESLVSAMPAAPGAPPLRPSISVTVAGGGTCGGQVPDRFIFQVSRRYAPEEDFAAIRMEIEAAIRRAAPACAGLRFDLTGHLIPTFDPEGPHYPRWIKAMQAGFGYAPQDFARYGAASASDSGYVQQAGVTQEIVLSGLIRPDSNAHGAQERTTCADLSALSHAIAAYLSAGFMPDLNPDIP